MKIGDIIRKALAEGKDTAAILALVKAEHPNAQTTSASVAWYKSQMKKGGNEAPKAPKAPQPKPIHQATAKALPMATDKGYTVGKFKETHGMEGPGFIVTLYRDGKPVAEAADYGDGAPVMWTWFDKKPATVKALTYDDKPREYEGTQEEALFWAHCISLPKYTETFSGKPREHHMSPNLRIEELVNDMRALKYYKRLMGKKILVVRNGKLWTYHASPTVENVKQVTEMAKKEDPLAIVLNKLLDHELLETTKAVIPAY